MQKPDNSGNLLIKIRPESRADFSTISRINTLAFGRPGEARLIEKLRQDAAFIPALSLVAETDGIPAGHILFTRITIENGSERHPSLALAPMAVLPEFQGKGIGSALVRSGLEKAADLGYPSVIVLGHESYYPRFGFSPASRWQIKAPFPVPDAAFMALELQAEGLKGRNGTVIYPSAFNDV